MPLITVCICTHNRAELLRECLEGLALQDGLERADVLVVDNNCSDHTQDVAASYRGAIPNLRIASESQPGLSHARNRGLSEAATPYIAYLDDDAVPQPGWLSGMIGAFVESGADAVAGKVEPYWKEARPWWITPTFYPLLGGLDLGDATFLPEGYFGPVGANMAVKTDLLRAMGAFDTRYGVCSIDGSEVNRYRGDDTDLGLRMADRRARVLYCGAAAVRHLTHGQCTRFGNIRRCAVQQGWTLGVLDSFDVERAENDLVWFCFSLLSNLVRFRGRDALIFYFLALERSSALREHHRVSRKSYSLWLASAGAAFRMRRGILGLGKRTLFGRPVEPWPAHVVHRSLGRVGSPAISVVMPCYNQAAYLPDAVRSLQAQTFEDWECIIVNDGSTDDTAAVACDLVARDPRVRYVEQDNGGLSAARNRGTAESVGRYIHFLDSDDLIAPEKFSAQMAVLRDCPEPALSYCDYLYCRADGTPDPDSVVYKPPVLDPGDPLSSMARDWEETVSIPIHCFLFDARLIESLGAPFDPVLPNHEDWDCWMRILAGRPTVFYVDRKLAYYREHGGSKTRRHAEMRSGFLRAIGKQMRLFRGDPAMQSKLRDTARATKIRYRDYVFPRSLWLAVITRPKSFLKAHLPGSAVEFIRRSLGARANR